MMYDSNVASWALHTHCVVQSEYSLSVHRHLHVTQSHTVCHVTCNHWTHSHSN